MDAGRSDKIERQRGNRADLIEILNLAVETYGQLIAPQTHANLFLERVVQRREIEGQVPVTGKVIRIELRSHANPIFKMIRTVEGDLLHVEIKTVGRVAVVIMVAGVGSGRAQRAVNGDAARSQGGQRQRGDGPKSFSHGFGQVCVNTPAASHLK